MTAGTGTLTTVGADQWAYVAAAYGVTAVLTLAVLIWAWRAMVRAERAADASRADRPRKDA